MPTKRIDWTIGDTVVPVIERAISRFGADHSPPAFAYYPLISWTEGGWAMSKAQGQKMPLPDRYDLALIKREDMAATTGWFPIASKRFGFIIFVPSADDAASGRRLIDYDGKDIVVR